VKWLRSSVEGAGLARYGAAAVITFLAGASTFAGLWAFGVTKVIALGVCIGFGAFGFGLEIVNLRAKSRRRELSSLWPEVIDSLQSAASSGIGFTEGFAELAQRGPLPLRKHFAGFTHRIDSGWPIETALDWLKRELGEIHADRLLELLHLVALAGGEGYQESLRNQSRQLREDLNLWGQLESKQGWVGGTAKMAVAAPWIVVAMLSARPETADIYNSPDGSTILAVGFAVSVVAYRFIHLLGALPTAPRVFA
jgi:tight adherence protein B